MSFRENLKDELKYQDIKVKELAEMTGIPKGTLDHYLAEKCTLPLAEAAVKIAKALGVTTEYLVTGKRELSQKNSASPQLAETVKKLELLSEIDLHTIQIVIDKFIKSYNH